MMEPFYPFIIFAKSSIFWTVFEYASAFGFKICVEQKSEIGTLGVSHVLGWRLVIANDVLKMRKVIELTNLWIVIYCKIHFCVLLQPICAGEVSAILVRDK